MEVSNQFATLSREARQILFHAPIAGHILIDIGVMLSNCFDGVGLRDGWRFSHGNERCERYE
jgi:hypothetical protein